MKTLQLSHMKERVQQLGNNISKHAKNAAGAVATTLLMMQANPDAAVAQ